LHHLLLHLAQLLKRVELAWLFDQLVFLEDGLLSTKYFIFVIGKEFGMVVNVRCFFTNLFALFLLFLAHGKSIPGSIAQLVQY